MFLILINLLKKFDYDINKSNIKYFLRILQEQKEKEDLIIQQKIIDMLDDIDNVKKLEQLARLEMLRSGDLER